MAQESIVLTSQEIHVRSLLEEAYTKRINDLPTSVKLTKQAISISKGFDSTKLYALSLNQLALFQMIVGEYEESITLSNEALALCKESNDIKGIADAKFNIASVYYKSDNFHLGLDYLLECLAMYNQISDYHSQARCLKSLGTIYEYFGDQQNAVSAYEDAIVAASKVNDLNLVSNAYNPLSGIYLNNGEIERAMEIIEKSIRLKKQTEDIRGLGFAYYGRGKVFTKTDEFDKAKADFDRAAQIHIKMGDNLGESMAYHKLGQLYVNNSKYQEAIKVLQKSIAIANKYKINLVIFKSTHLLYQAHKALGNKSMALEYLEKYTIHRDVVIKNHTYKVIKSYDSIAKIEQLEKDAELQKQRTDIIENKNRELDSFFYRVSHDLKGPITSLMGLNNLTDREEVPENIRMYFNMYKKQTHRINNIVMELINLTRMDHKKENRKKIDFEEIINDCISSYHYLDNFPLIEFKVNVSQNLHFESEWSIVNTIIQNLLENAIKYARLEDNQPQVIVEIENEKEGVIIKVIDNGLGIDKDSQSNIFDMFYRASPIADGSGLGLYILKRAVERLDGSIKLSSVPDEGTEFQVLLPHQG